MRKTDLAGKTDIDKSIPIRQLKFSPIKYGIIMIKICKHYNSMVDTYSSDFAPRSATKI